MKSVFSKMLTSCIIVLFITLAFTSSILLVMTQNYMSDREEERAAVSAEELGSLLKYRAPENAQLFNRIIASYVTKLDATVFVCDKNGLVRISQGSVSGSLQEYVPTGYQLNLSQYQKVISGEKINERGDFGGYFSKNVVTAGVPLNIDGYIQGGVFVCRSIPDVNELTGEMKQYFVLAVILSMVFAFVVIYITAKRITAPISRMKKTTRAFAAGKFGERASVDGCDEIAELAAEFNNMADSLENLENNRRAFVADISHELRTPMTTISGFIEGVLDGTIPAESQDKYLKIVLDETKRLTRMVNDILYAEKYRRCETVIAKERFDVNEVIRLVLIGLERRISEKNIEAAASFEYESEFVFAHRDSITRVITNLADNAVKFADNGGSLVISTENHNGKCRITVFNSGSYIPPEDRNRIFDRFYKTDKSRGIDKTGVGLGLHIVRSILAQHSSPINVSSDNEGTTFEFFLELSQEKSN